MSYEKFILAIETNCQSNLSPITTENPQKICEGVTTTTLHVCIYMLLTAGDPLQVFNSYYIFKIMAVIAYSLIQVCMTPIQGCSVSNQLATEHLTISGCHLSTTRVITREPPTLSIYCTGGTPCIRKEPMLSVSLTVWNTQHGFFPDGENFLVDP